MKAIGSKNMFECKLRRRLARALTGFAAAIGFAALSVVAQAADCAKDTLCRVIAEGKLKAGVVVDYKPWGYRGAGGEFLGLEPDMARDVARTLGIEVEF